MSSSLKHWLQILAVSRHVFFLFYLKHGLLHPLCYPVTGVDVPGHLSQFVGPRRRLALGATPLEVPLLGRRTVNRRLQLYSDSRQQKRKDLDGSSDVSSCRSLRSGQGTYIRCSPPLPPTRITQGYRSAAFKDEVELENFVHSACVIWRAAVKSQTQLDNIFKDIHTCVYVTRKKNKNIFYSLLYI